jgi:NAD-dependent DNA ligase
MPLPNVIFDGKQFVMTGRFFYGTRSNCEKKVIERGGTCKSHVSMQTDYLIIGSLGSPDWIHTNYGRKIEAAMAYKQDGFDIRIVGEEHWATFL